MKQVEPSQKWEATVWEEKMRAGVEAWEFFQSGCLRRLLTDAGRTGGEESGEWEFSGETTF